MQKILKGSKTEANLMTAFSGESQARNKYTFFGAQAKAEGYEQIGNLFLETANNEKEHAEIWFKLLQGGMQDTQQNLETAAQGEQYEWETMYPAFAKEAREEGFPKIAALFELVAKIEQEHMQRYQVLLQNVKDQTVFKKPQSTLWICLNCGHIYEGTQPPKTCPVCEKPQGWFQIKADNY